MRRIVSIISLLFLFFVGCDMNVLVKDPSNPIDEWETTTPEEQGLDSNLLSRAFAKADQMNFVNSILIVRNEHLVADIYFNGYKPKDAHNFKGVSSVALSALTGIALRENFIDSLNQPILDFFPEYVTPKLDRRKLDIKIRHLLTMKAGFDKERNNYQYVISSKNWINTTINLPLITEPDDQFRYNTFQLHLLSGIITKASAMSMMNFANKYLFDPLKVSVDHWEKDPQGIYFGGTDMFFTPRNVARIGLMFLKNGYIDGQQIIPAEWIETSLQNYTGFENRTWGEFHDYNYGYIWWIGKIKEYDVCLEIGFGGQFLINIPELNMVIVTTAYYQVDWDQADRQEREIINLVANYILPAVVE